MWLIDGFRAVQLVRGSLLAGYPEGSPPDVGDPGLFGFSSILAGTSIELFQKCNFPLILLDLREWGLIRIGPEG